MADRKMKQLRLRQTVLLCFYSLYLHTANGAARHICPQHYLHLGFIRAILTCVPSDRWEGFFYTSPAVAKMGQKKKRGNYNDRAEVLTAFVYCVEQEGLKMEHVSKIEDLSKLL